MDDRLATRSFAAAGARTGAVVWGVYGVAEFLFDSVVPLLHEPSHVLTAWHWKIGGALLVIYVLAGALLGAAAGAVLRRDNAVRPAVTATLLCAFFGQILHRELFGGTRYASLAALVVACGFLATRVHWKRMINPILVAVVLAALPVLWFARVGPVEAASASAVAAPAGLPDVVLIVMDTVRADHVSFQGYPRDTTPRLSALARQATVYSRAVAASNYSLPSHASIVTGLYPRRHGAHAASPGGAPGAALGARFDTVAELLSRRGYDTVLIGANSGFLNRWFGLTQGFRTVRAPSLFPNPYHLRRAVQRAFQFTQFGEMHRSYASAETINRLAYAEIAAHRARAPLFLFLNYMDAHLPVVVPGPIRGGPCRLTYQQHADLMHDVERDGHVLTETESAAINGCYDAAIRYQDEQIGSLIAHLRGIGRFDKALILITSDHGDTLGQAGHAGHGPDTCEREVHVPLLVKYPGEHEARVVAEPVSHVDLVPTILDVALGQSPANTDGVSLARLGTPATRPVLTESLWPTQERPSERAVYVGSRKLVASSDGSYRLYDLASDPRERDNLYEDAPAAGQPLKAALEGWLAATPPFVPPATRAGTVLMERLKALGYVQ